MIGTMHRNLLLVIFCTGPVVTRADQPDDPKGDPNKALEYPQNSLGGSYTGWTELQNISQFDNSEAPAVPGEAGLVPVAGGKVRIPFFLIWTAGEREDLWADAHFLASMEQLILSDSDTPSCRNYLNQTFGEKLDFFKEGDLIPIKLPKMLGQYFQGQHPNRMFFNDLAEATKQLDWDAYDNDNIEGRLTKDGKNDQDDNEADMVVLIMVTGNAQLVGTKRSWVEWTTDSGWGSPTSKEKLLQPQPVGNPADKIEISSFCFGRVFEDEDATIPRSIGWVVHEILHCFGLPDLYDDDKSSAGCGCFCSMSWGMHGVIEKTSSPNWHAVPVFPSAWCRQQLGFSARGEVRYPAPGEPALEDDVSLPSPLDVGPNSFVRFDLPPKEGSPHYLLVELRGPGLNQPPYYDWDQEFKKKGFLIWEIDESVGKKYKNSSGEQLVNPIWPSCLVGPRSWYTDWNRQNDTDSRPLVGLLQRRNPPSVIQGNLPSNRVYDDTCVWDLPDQVCEHMGVKLFDFNPGTRHFKYRVTNPTGTPPLPPDTIAINPTPASVAPSAPGDEMSLVYTGTGAQLRKSVPPQIASRMERLFAEYPRYDFAVRENNGQTVVAAPVPVTSSTAMAKNVISQIKSMNLLANGTDDYQNNGKVTVSKESIDKLFKDKTREIQASLYARVDGQEIRVSGLQMRLSRTGQDADKITYKVPTATALPNLPKDLKGTLSKEAFQDFIQNRFPRFIAKKATEGKLPEWELVAEKDSGKLKWQCRIPTVPASRPIVLEIDASQDQNQLGSKTLVKLK